MYKRFLLSFCFFIFILFSGCTASTEGKAYQSEFFAMDTVVSFTVHGEDGRDAAYSAEREIYRLEQLLSTQLTGSEIYELNANGTVHMSAETQKIVECAFDLYRETGGALDITVYPIVNEWGFFSGEHALPAPERIDALLSLTGSGAISIAGNTLTLEKEGMGIDLGAIAKGYASDKAAETLKDMGVKSAILSLGGNVCAVGAKPDGSAWRVAITDPFDPDSVIGSIEVRDKSVVTSGGYQRNFESGGKTYHHIIDPKTGYPAESGLASVTVVCDSGMLADGLSTALFVMGGDLAASFWREGARAFEAVFVHSDGTIVVTEGLADNFSGSDFTVLTR